MANRNDRSRKSQPRCTHCGEDDHTARKCPLREFSSAAANAMMEEWAWFLAERVIMVARSNEALEMSRRQAWADLIARATAGGFDSAPAPQAPKVAPGARIVTTGGRCFGVLDGGRATTGADRTLARTAGIIPLVARETADGPSNASMAELFGIEIEIDGGCTPVA